RGEGGDARPGARRRPDREQGLREAVREGLGGVVAGIRIQSTGCPWCTTPTTCGEVQENANIGGCYNIGNGCQTIPGKCTINETFAAADIAEILHLERVEGLGW